MFNINPFRQHRANNEVLKEDPAHYANIAKKDAEHRAKLGKKPMPNMYDKKFSLNKKKNEDMGEFSGDVKLMGDKKLKHHATTGEKNKKFSHNKIKKEYERRKGASARRTSLFGKDTTPSGKAGPSYESVGKTAGDKSYYNLQRAKDLAKKDGHDYDKLPQYDRTHDKHKDHYDARAKKESVKSESVKYHIPEDIPANERTAFHGAAAAAAKQNKKSFSFGGKTHPVTMKKDTATKIADQKESKMTFREKLMSIFEGDRKAHYKGATEPEGMHDKYKSSKGAMDMVNTSKEVAADGKKAADDNAAKSAEKKMGKAKKRSSGDNVGKGDTTIIPSATPVKEPSMAKEEYGMFGSKVSKNLLDAIAMVEDMDKIHTVDIDHTTGKAGSHEKKHGVTIKKNPKAGPYAVDATGTKANLQKYLKKHYDGDHKTMHPEIYK